MKTINSSVTFQNLTIYLLWPNLKKTDIGSKYTNYSFFEVCGSQHFWALGFIFLNRPFFRSVFSSQQLMPTPLLFSFLTLFPSHLKEHGSQGRGGQGWELERDALLALFSHLRSQQERAESSSSPSANSDGVLEQGSHQLLPGTNSPESPAALRSGLQPPWLLHSRQDSPSGLGTSMDSSGRQLLGSTLEICSAPASCLSSDETNWGLLVPFEK